MNTQSIYRLQGYVLRCTRCCLSFKLSIDYKRVTRLNRIMSTLNYLLLTLIVKLSTTPIPIKNYYTNHNESFDDSTETYQGRASRSNTARLLCQPSCSQPAQIGHDGRRGGGHIKGSETKTITRNLSWHCHSHARVPSKFDRLAGEGHA